MFWNVFYGLCLLHDKKPNPVAKELGISSGTITKWKNGSLPNSSALRKLADYFDVSVDYLLGKTDQEKPTAIIDGEPIGEDVIIFHRDGKTQKRKLTKDQMAMLIAMVDALPESEDED